MAFLRQLQGTFRSPEFVRCAKLTKQTTVCGRVNSICSQHQPANECHHGTATNRGPHSLWHKELLLHQVVPKLTTRKWMVFQFQTSENGRAHCFRLKDRSPKAKATTRPEVKRSNRWTRPYWCSGSRHTSKQLRNRWFYSTVDTESSKNPRAKQNKKSWAVIRFEKMAPLQSHGISSCSISRWFGGPHGQTSHGIVAPKDFCHLRSVHVHSQTTQRQENTKRTHVQYNLWSKYCHILNIKVKYLVRAVILELVLPDVSCLASDQSSK